MLKIYICKKCYNFRMVSRKKDAICFHCGAALVQCDIDYGTFMSLTEEERGRLKDTYKSRIL